MAMANTMLSEASHGDLIDLPEELQENWDAFYNEWQNLDPTIAWNVECCMQEAVMDEVHDFSFRTSSQKTAAASQSDSAEENCNPTIYNFGHLHSLSSFTPITSSMPPSSRLGDYSSQPSTPIFTPPTSVTLPNEIVGKSLEVQQYSCRYCDQSFDRRHMLNRHERLHTKPVKCPVEGCTNRVAKARDMNRHIMAQHPDHDLARPLLALASYKCPIAECRFSRRGFRRRDNLKRHMRNTHGEAFGGKGT